MQVVISYLRRLQLVHARERAFLFCKIVLQARRLRCGENWPVMDDTTSQFRSAHYGHTPGNRALVTGGQEILDVNHRESIGIVLEVVDGIAATEDHPAAVDLEFYELWVGFLQQQVVTDGATALSCEFKAVIVIHVLQPGALGFLTDAIGKRGSPLRFIRTHRR